MKIAPLAAFGLACALLWSPVSPARALEAAPPLDTPIDLKVTQANAKEVFQTFGQILSAEAEIDPALAGRTLSIQLERVRVRTALTAACDSVGCEWSFIEGKPGKLSVRAAAAPAAKPADKKKSGLDDRIDIRVKQAKIAEVLRTAGQILSVDVSLDPKVAGEIDLDLTGVAVREVLTRICAQAGCRWSLVEGAKPSLVVTSAK
jgi:type II secretory pathway component GspD/PulD (secretin)